MNNPILFKSRPMLKKEFLKKEFSEVKKEAKDEIINCMKNRKEDESIDDFFRAIMYTQNITNESTEEELTLFHNNATDEEKSVKKIFQNHPSLQSAIEKICFHRNNIRYKSFKNSMRGLFNCCSHSQYEFGEKEQFNLLDTVFTQTAEELIKEIINGIEILNKPEPVNESLHKGEIDKLLLHNDAKIVKRSSVDNNRKPSNPDIISYSNEQTPPIVPIGKVKSVREEINEKNFAIEFLKFKENIEQLITKIERKEVKAKEIRDYIENMQIENARFFIIGKASTKQKNEFLTFYTRQRFDFIKIEKKLREEIGKT